MSALSMLLTAQLLPRLSTMTTAGGAAAAHHRPIADGS
jgi:hypothetical protein